MRTTVTLDADVDAAVRRLMRERRLTFKEAVNEAIRTGFARPPAATPYRTAAVAMGSPMVPLDKSLRLAAQLEDDELVRKLAIRK